MQMGRYVSLSFHRLPFGRCDTDWIIRPVSQGPGEVRGFLERANYMLDIAESSLADVTLEDTDRPGFRRYIKREPLGVVLVIAPWKYVIAL
jgi:acyl-CoA reductase-like NAD-dependent aldehyde dehydrogenase